MYFNTFKIFVMYFVRDMIIDLCSADSVLLKVEDGYAFIV
jgi:hypothetical protein